MSTRVSSGRAHTCWDVFVGEECVIDVLKGLCHLDAVAAAIHGAHLSEWVTT